MDDDLYISLVSEEGRKAFPIPASDSYIGRSESCNIQLNDAYISSIHAKISRIENDVRIEDLGSVNGVYVDGERIKDHTLSNESIIQLGSEKFKLEYKNINAKITDPDKSTVFKIPGKDQVTTIAEDLVSINAHELEKYDQRAFVKLDQVKFQSAENQDVYLFEDKNLIRPILKKAEIPKSLEVVKMFRDTIISIDYYPLKGRRIYISGRSSYKDSLFIDTLESDDYKGILEYQKNRKVKFFPVVGHDNFVVRKGETTQLYKKSLLNFDDLIKVKKDYFSISLKMVDTPPEILGVPFTGYDQRFKVLVILALLISISVFSVAQLFPVEKKKNEPEKKEKVTKVIYRPQPKPKEPEKVIKVKKELESSSRSVETKEPMKKVVKKITKKVEVISEKSKTIKKKRVGTNKTNEVVKSSQKNIKKVARFKKFNFSKDLKSLRLTKKKSVNFGSRTAEVISVKRQEAMDLNVGKIEAAQSDGVKAKVELGSLGSVVSSRGRGTFGVNKKTNFSRSYGKTILLGSIDPEIIRELLRRNLPQFRYCYDEELRRKKKKVKGKMKLDFVIGPNGRVSRSTIGLDSFRMSVDGTKCMKRVLRGIAFPRPKGGGIVEVTQPIFLEPEF